MILGSERALRAPHLVGRAPELRALADGLARTGAGAGQTILIGGEAGVGKSRLVAETRALAERDGFLVLTGACFEPDQALPHAPLRDLLHTLSIDGPPEAVAALAEAGPALRPLLSDQAPAPPEPGDLEPSRLVLAIERLLARLAAARPLLIVVEDLHWSDEASLDILRRLARRLTRLPVLLLLTYRDDEAPPALEHLLAELSRERLAREIHLRALDRAGVEAMLRAILALDRPPGAEFVATVAALTDGNPFFVEEVLAALVATGDIVPAPGGWSRKPLGALRVPRTVQDAVRRRAAGLSPTARELLELAAVAGRRFDFVLLQALTTHAEADLLAVMKELIAARLVIEESADAFAFRHALIREAIYAGMLARERVGLHRRVAEALAELHAGAFERCLEDLVYHAVEAGAWEQVHELAPRAGDRARAVGAPRAAIAQYDRALTAAARLGLPPAPATLRARALARATAGDFAGALADLTQVLDLVRAAGDRRDEWQALLDLGFHWSERDLAHSHAYLDQALTLARAIGDPVILAHSLNRLGNWHANQDRLDDALRLHQEAGAIFTRLDDRAGLAATYDMLSMALSLYGDLAAAGRYAERAIALYRELGDRQGIISALTQIKIPGVYEIQTSVATATLPEAIPMLDQALTLAREIGWRSGESYLLAISGEAWLASGDFGRGLALLREGVALADEIEHREWQMQTRAGLAIAYAELGDLATGRDLLRDALSTARQMHSRLWINNLAGGLAAAHIALGEHAAAAALLTELLAPESPVRGQGWRLLWLARIELDLATGDPLAAQTHLDRLFASAPGLTDEADIPRLALLRAEALAALGRLDDAVALLQRAQATTRADGSRLALLRLQIALARLTAGRLPVAETATAEARALVGELAASIDDGLRRSFLAAVEAALPPAAPERRPEPERSELTPREREVALWIARGRTNREIAAELFVGERTVETHVGKILQKLGFTSRAQIAAWVSEQGLSAETP